MWICFNNSFVWLMDGKNLLLNNSFGSCHFLIHQIKKGQKIAKAKTVFKIKNQFFYARQPRKGIFKTHSHLCCSFITFFPELLTAAIIPGVEIFSWKSAFVVFFNMPNANFWGAPESEKRVCTNEYGNKFLLLTWQISRYCHGTMLLRWSFYQILTRYRTPIGFHTKQPNWLFHLEPGGFLFQYVKLRCPC